ncbi:MFS transporter [Mariniluteicoccus endophyticus]
MPSGSPAVLLPRTSRKSRSTRSTRNRGLPTGLVALTVRHYRTYFGALFLGSLGFWIQRIAQDWLVLELTGSASAVGVAVALQFAPVLALGLYGGVLVDRFDARRLLAISQTVCAVLAGVLAVLVATDRVTMWACYGLALGIGLTSVVEQPARMQLVTSLVGLSRLRSALGLNSTAFQSAGLAGPLVAGGVIHTLGLSWCFAINVLGCLTVIAACALMRTGAPLESDRREAEPQSQVAALVEGLRHVVHRSEIAWSITLVAVMGVFGTNLAVLLTAFSQREFGTGVSGYSTFNALVALGCVAGALIGAQRTTTMRLRRLTAVMGVFGVLLMLVSRAPGQGLFVAGLAVVGVLMMTFQLSANSTVQMAAPTHVRGRVMSVYVLVLLGGQTIGGLLIGSVVDAYGARLGMMLCGAAITTLGGLCALGMAYQSHLTLSFRRGLVPTIVQR